MAGKPGIIQSNQSKIFNISMNKFTTIKEVASIFLTFAGCMGIMGCIGDDIIDDRVPEKIRITIFVDTMAVDESYQFEAMYFNEVGEEEAAPFIWKSTNESIITIDNNGLATAHALGSSVITVETTLNNGDIISDQQTVEVTEEGDIEENPGARTGRISTTSSYLLEGDFRLEETEDGLVLTLEDNFKATSALPGLYVYLGNNETSIASAFEIGMVYQFEGKHTYEIQGAGIYEYEILLFWCKPFNVKVGEGVFNN